ncbi:MAG: hypothetical protein HQL30_04795 [Candidatus Omnitrophica bacterium]|nr:hypothetical protein [Candidatus Omnitrophota bacterium]
MITKLANKLFRRSTIGVVVVFTLNSSIPAFSGGLAEFTPSVDTKQGFEDLDLGAIAVPFKLGEVDEVLAGNNGKTIIHIPDAHCNYAAQKTIEGLIQYLIDTYGIKMISLEGGRGSYDLSVFTGIQDAVERKEVSDYFLREGRISGPEDIAINSAAEMELFGVEDDALYFKNLNAYRSSLGSKDEALGYIAALKNAFSNLKERIYPSNMREADKLFRSYRDKELSFKEYIAAAVNSALLAGMDMSGYPSINELMAILGMEKSIDFKKANIERDALVEKLSKKLSGASGAALAVKTAAFKDGDMTAKEFYAFLFSKADFISYDAKQLANMSKYREYVTRYEALDKGLVSEEINSMFESLMGVLSDTGDQRELYAMDADLRLIEDMFNITLIRKEFDRYIADKGKFDTFRYLDFIKKKGPAYGLEISSMGEVSKLDALRDKMELFYRSSLERDEAFIRNIGSKMDQGGKKVTILVTGGFHADNLAGLFRDVGYSYIKVMPKFVNNKEVENPYIRLLSGGKSSLEKMIETFVTTSNIAIESMLSEMGIEGYKGDKDLFALAVEAERALRNGGAFGIAVKGLGYFKLTATPKNKEMAEELGEAHGKPLYAERFEGTETDADPGMVSFVDVEYLREALTYKGHQTIVDLLLKKAHAGEGGVKAVSINEINAQVAEAWTGDFGLDIEDWQELLRLNKKYAFINVITGSNGETLKFKIGSESPGYGINLTYSSDADGAFDSRWFVACLLHEMSAFAFPDVEHRDNLDVEGIAGTDKGTPVRMNRGAISGLMNSLKSRLYNLQAEGEMKERRGIEIIPVSALLEKNWSDGMESRFYGKFNDLLGAIRDKAAGEVSRRVDIRSMRSVESYFAVTMVKNMNREMWKLFGHSDLERNTFFGTGDVRGYMRGNCAVICLFGFEVLRLNGDLSVDLALNEESSKGIRMAMCMRMLRTDFFLRDVIKTLEKDRSGPSEYILNAEKNFRDVVENLREESEFFDASVDGARELLSSVWFALDLTLPDQRRIPLIRVFHEIEETIRSLTAQKNTLINMAAKTKGRDIDGAQLKQLYDAWSNCNDLCEIITQNMKAIGQELNFLQDDADEMAEKMRASNKHEDAEREDARARAFFKMRSDLGIKLSAIFFTENAVYDMKGSNSVLKNRFYNPVSRTLSSGNKLLNWAKGWRGCDTIEAYCAGWIKALDTMGAKKGAVETSREDLERARNIIDELRRANDWFRKGVQALAKKRNPGILELRYLFENWISLREMAGKTEVLMADSNEEDPAQRGIIANFDQNSQASLGITLPVSLFMPGFFNIDIENGEKRKVEKDIVEAKDFNSPELVFRERVESWSEENAANLENACAKWREWVASVSDGEKEVGSETRTNITGNKDTINRILDHIQASAARFRELSRSMKGREITGEELQNLLLAWNDLYASIKHFRDNLLDPATNGGLIELKDLQVVQVMIISEDLAGFLVHFDQVSDNPVRTAIYDLFKRFSTNPRGDFAEAEGVISGMADRVDSPVRVVEDKKGINRVSVASKNYVSLDAARLTIAVKGQVKELGGFLSTVMNKDIPESYSVIAGAEPTDENGDVVTGDLFDSSLTKLKSSERHFVKMRLGDSNIQLYQTMGVMNAVEAVLDLPIEGLKERTGLSDTRTRIDFQISSWVLAAIEAMLTAEKLEADQGEKINALKALLGGGTLQAYLEANTMLTVWTDKDEKTGQVFPMPYGLLMGASFANLNVGYVTEKILKDPARKDMEELKQAVQLKAKGVAIATNDLNNEQAIFESFWKLVGQGEKENLQNFIKAVLELTLPAVAPLNIGEIKELFAAQAEVWRSL